MSLVFRLAFFVLVLRPGSLACPSACQCFGPIWHCTEIRSLDELVAVGHKEVEQMHLIDGRVDFPRRFLAEFPNLRLLNISRSRIACTESALWLLEIDHLVKNWTQLYCTSPQVLERTPVTKALHWIRQVDSQCPDRCVCQLLNVPQDDQYVTVTIDCIGQNLVELPKTLPSNVTIHLDLSQNQIENLDDLVTNPSYVRVTHLYLNDNRIKSVSVLDDSDWIRYFSLLSLTGNSLQEISTEALTRAFQHSSSSRDVGGIRMFLSNNPWRCGDCFQVTSFQTFIAQYWSLIKDFTKVSCGQNEGENAGKKLIAVDTASVCHPDENLIDFFERLSLAFALFITFTIGKLLYDYYHYRKSGRLPWPVSVVR